MATEIKKLFLKNLGRADEVRTAEKLKVEVVDLGGYKVMRATFQPGWRWSQHVKPVVKTDLCQVAHIGYLVSGSLATRLKDGTEIVGKPGDCVTIPPGHDGWVVGNEPAVFIDFVGGETYAKK